MLWCQICGDNCAWTLYKYSGVSPDPDIHNDRVNGELETFLLQSRQADTTCATEEVTANSTLLNTCITIQNELNLYIQAARAYVSKQSRVLIK